MEIREILHGSLSWMPKHAAQPEEFPGRFFLAAKLCFPTIPESEDVSGPEELELYKVVHYTAKALGSAFGPFSLARVQHFCHNLGQLSDQGLLVGIGCQDGAKSRANAAVLLGAYLVLRHSWTLEQVIESIGENDADLTFACSWSDAQTDDESNRTLRVRDCWEGLVLAVNHGWIEASKIMDMAENFKSCNALDNIVQTYDAAWLVPGRVLVCADPVTVVVDPNPATLKEIFPGDFLAERSPQKPSLKHSATAKSSRSGGSGGNSSPRSMAKSNSSLADSCDTVCKDYGAFGNHTGADTPSGDAVPKQSFVEFLRTNRIGLLVRLNTWDEPGMPDWIYESRKLKNYGIRHLDMPIPDVRGGLPERWQVARYLKAAAEVEPQAVAVHCKGGFGRSVSLACCLIIAQFDVPGRALLGWVRMARPGAITTSSQEKFLVKLRGREDVLSMSSSCASCATACSLL